MASGLPAARRGGRPHLLRPRRPDQRDRALRPRARDQVRDLRDHPHQGRDHRRAALAGLGAALGARPRARDRDAPTRSSSTSCSARPTDEEMADELGDHRRRLPGVAAADLQLDRSPRSTSCGRSATPAATRSRCSTRSRTRARRTRRRSWTPTDLKDRVADAIARLPEREKLVVALYYYENLTLREIGEVLGVTESRISQLHTKAVLRLRSRCADDLAATASSWAPAAARRG